jgi:acetamidase/formamidase
MATAHRHTIHQRHYGWDRSFAPAARIAPGDSLEFDVSDASGGQLSETSTVGDVAGLDSAREIKDLSPAAPTSFRYSYR